MGLEKEGSEDCSPETLTGWPKQRLLQDLITSKYIPTKQVKVVAARAHPWKRKPFNDDVAAYTSVCERPASLLVGSWRRVVA